jgi:cytochrome c
VSTDKGGAAFPVLPPIILTDYPWLEEGMTLLDYFAGQALIACADDFIKSAMPRSSMAREAYDIAAAMLAEKRRREK